MKLNESTTDRVIRVVAGLVLAYAAIANFLGLSILWWILAALLVATGVVGFCPIYRVLNLSTRKATPAKE